MRRLEVLNHTLAENTKFILPSGGDFVNVLGLGDMGDNKGGTPSVVPIKRP